MKLFTVLNIRRAVLITGLVLAQSGQAHIEVYGYQYPELFDETPPIKLGDDAVVGRLACPPVTRLNLTRKASEALLVKRVVVDTVTSRDGKQQVYWRFDLKDDVYWWDASQVSAADFVEFFLKNISLAARERGQWDVPSYKVFSKDDTDPSAIDKDDAVAKNPRHVFVVWSKAPEFDEYILNNIPLYRPLPATSPDDQAKASAKPSYECVGLYSFEKYRGNLRLTPTKGYSGSRPQIDISSQLIRDGKASKEWVEFRTASFYGGNPWTRFSDESADCWRKVDWPVMTGIIWNLKKLPTADVEFRKAMTELTPRGALLRSGAAGLGDLLSGPVPRSHPGYNSSVLVRPFSSELGAAKLGVLGFKRQAASSPRLDKQGNPLKLRIGTSPNSQGLIEKVLTDAFAAVGVSLTFAPVNLRQVISERGEFIQDFDGVLTGVSLDWPRNDFLAFLPGLRYQAQSPQSKFETEKTPILSKKHLLSYARSLTSSKPDFSLLTSIHHQWYSLEPATILLQHQICLEASASLRKKQSATDISDPDWFRRLVL